MFDILTVYCDPDTRGFTVYQMRVFTATLCDIHNNFFVSPLGDFPFYSVHLLLHTNALLFVHALSKSISICL